jgi:hypothetical protein
VPDGSASSIAVASTRDDGLAHVELVAHEQGTGWLVAEVARIAREHKADRVLVDPRTPASTAITLLRELSVTVTEVTSLDVTQAHAAFVTACQEGKLRHIGQPELASALTGAVRRPVGDAFAWSRRSSGVDISPLVAVTLAAWGLNTFPRRRRPRIINLSWYLHDEEVEDPWLADLEEEPA